MENSHTIETIAQKKLLDKDGKRLYEIMAGKFIQKPRQNLPVWKIDTSTNHFYFLYRTWDADGITRMGNLLEEILLEFPENAILYDCEIDPIKYKLKGSWVKVGKRAWKIPQDLDFDELYTELFPSPWWIIVKRECNNNAENHSGYNLRKSDQLESKILYLMKNNLYLMIEAWHDMTPLYISINPDYWSATAS